MQLRERDGWSGLDVIIRAIDGIFYDEKAFTLAGVMQKGPKFDEMVHKKQLEELKERIKNKEDQGQLKKELVDFKDLGFPSSQWFSDHLPVGGIFKFVGK